MIANQQSPRWAIEELRTLSFRDKRLVRKAISLLQRISQNPSLPISRFSSNKAEQDSFYRFIGNKKTTFESILAAHQNETFLRMKEVSNKILLIEDTTTIETLHLEDYEDGPISSGSKTGFILHTTLAVDLDNNKILGIPSALLWKRSSEKKPKEETGAERKKRTRESVKWVIPQLDAIEKSTKIEVEGKQFIIVGDREADIYEVYLYQKKVGHGFEIGRAHV